MPGTIFLSELLTPKSLRTMVETYGCGLELIAFSVSENLDRFEETMSCVKDLLAFLGNPPCCVHGPFLDLNPMSYDSRIRQVTMERFSQAYDAAERLGAERIVFHSGMIPTVYYLEGWASRMGEFWNAFLEGKSGIPVCMENVLDQEIEPFRDVLSFVEHPDFGICLDVGHAHCYSNYPVTKWLNLLGGSIRHLHLHDNDGRTDSHRGIGQGTIPYDRLWCHPVFGSGEVTVTVECANETEAASSLEMLRLAGAGKGRSEPMNGDRRGCGAVPKRRKRSGAE